MLKNYGVQLFTLREEIVQDFAGVLEALARMGYGEVEGFGGMPLEPNELKALLEQNGLTMPSSHVMLDVLESDLEAQVAMAKTVGMKYLVVPWMNKDDHRTRAQVEGLAARLEKVGRALAVHGLGLAYHHHDFELHPLEDAPETTMLDVILETSDSKTVKLELDTFWMWYGGRDPVAAIRQYGKRICVVHLKDGERGPERAHFLELGRGKLDFPGILAACDALELQHRFVEQDQCDGPPLESVQISATYLQDSSLQSSSAGA
jgi:sugar phosphate isomerase/epimerase